MAAKRKPSAARVRCSVAKRGGQGLTRQRARDRELFLVELSTHGVVTFAAAVVGISRTTAYEWRNQDKAFAAAWDAAIEESTDRLEYEAVRRAVDGCDRPVFYQGEKCGDVREYSDTLMVLLLKARRPAAYREQRQVELSGPGGSPMEQVVFYLPRNGREAAAVNDNDASAVRKGAPPKGEA